MKARNAFAVLLAACLPPVASAVSDVWRATPEEITRTVNDRLAGEFVSHDGLLLDYVGDIPTPEEIADLKPNAMGWWCPIENGSMFTGEWLPALMFEGAGTVTFDTSALEGCAKLAVELVGLGEKPPKSVAILSVGEEYADDVEAMLEVANDYAATHQMAIVRKTVDAPSGGGRLVTFSAEFKRGALLLIR